MNLMVCMRGEPDELSFLAEVAELEAGIELQSYGMIGVQSARDWETRFAQHKAIRSQFQGPVAVHGPFIGMEYIHIDHLIRDVVLRRLEMTFDVAVKLEASRVVLHSGYRAEIDLFKLQDEWLKRSVSLETEDKMEVKMGDLRKLATHFASTRHRAAGHTNSTVANSSV